jgi:ABC-type glycerol-3-phosphate transport system substrate-binding protein
MKSLQRTLLFCAAFALAASTLISAANKYEAPGSIMHVVTVKWKETATPEQRQAALQGVRKMAEQIPGITRVWIKGTKVQPRDFNDAFVVEFRDKAAADLYVDHPAHREWEKIYLPIREASVSHQITN